MPHLITITSHDSFHTGNGGTLLRQSLHLLALMTVQLCFVLISVQIVTSLICIFPPFAECLDVGTFKQTTWAFCCTVLFQSHVASQGNVLVKCFNDVAFQKCANTIVRWELLGYWLKKTNLFCLLILSLQHSIFVYCSNKGLCKKSSLQRSVVKNTWLS